MKEKIINFINKNRTVFITAAVIIAVFGFFIFQTEKPTSLNGMIRKGEKYTEEGKLAVALELYNKLVRDYPKSYEAHLRLGTLYLQVNEPEKAKIEFYRAIKLGHKNRYDAHFAMANLYASENSYDLAQELISSIKDVKTRPVEGGIGDFYKGWGDKLVNQDPLGAIRKYKEAIEFYNRSNSRNLKEARNSLESTYAQVADNLVNEGNTNEAIKILNLSLGFFDNATAHFKLARIYEKSNIDKALQHYDKAYKINSKISNPDGYIYLLVKKGNILKSQNDMVGAEYFFSKAKKLKPNVKVPFNPDKHILVNLISTRYSEDMEKDIMIPGVSFRIMNVSKEKINYLKAKVVFLKDEEYLSENIQDIATEEYPIAPDALTKEYNVFSSKPVDHLFTNHNIRIQIFISQSNPDRWKLYRNAYLVRRQKNDIIYR